MIEIDGGILEGGGQLLRVSVALAATLNTSVKVTNIRAKRKPPGLKPQHIAALKAISLISNGKLENAYQGSSEITFHPSKLVGGTFNINIGTAGAISLVLQALIPVTLFASRKVNLTIKGGTNVKWSPPMDYFENVHIPIIKQLDAEVSVETVRRGCYPKGGGIVHAIIKPVEALKPLVLSERGEVEKINGIVFCEKLPKHIAEREKRSAENKLSEEGYDAEISVKTGNTSFSPCTGIVLWALTENKCILGSDSLGEKGKPAEKVGEEAAKQLIDELKSNATVDIYMGDQILLYLALASGESEVLVREVTLHAKTQIYILEKILKAKFEVKNENGLKRIHVKGIGFTR